VNRIAGKFEELRVAGRKGLVGYLTAGDPDVRTSERNIRLAVKNGVDLLELGIPFSDPTADGPVIQAAAHRALESGMTLDKALAMVARLRRDLDTPIVLFGYANPLFRYGYRRVCQAAAKAGADGFLVVDLPFEESGELRGEMDRCGLAFIPLIAPTTPKERMALILREARGFVYYIMFRGVTGARREVASDIGAHVRQVRRYTDLPVAVGFGIGSGKQAKEAAQAADAVVVGSALVQAATQGKLIGLVRELRQGLDGRRRQSSR
jgi:tryptophan synthase alpha chain